MKTGGEAGAGPDRTCLERSWIEASHAGRGDPVWLRGRESTWLGSSEQGWDG